MRKLTVNTSFWFFTIVIILGLLVLHLVQDGMFVDGVTYATISKNMANGIGTELKPHYTYLTANGFYGHPPLVFIIESIFFRVFGDGMHTERFFSLFNALFTTIGIVKCWQIISTKKSKQSWFPVLLWILTPIIFWSYTNNILENTLSVFTLFAVYFILKSIGSQHIAYLLIGGVFIMLAFLSKGPVGLFPLATPILYGVVYKFKKNKKIILYNLYLLIWFSALSCLLLFFFPELKTNLSNYFKQQVFPAITNTSEVTTSHHFHLVFELLSNLLIPIVFTSVVIVIKRTKRPDFAITYSKGSLLFLLIGLSASLPLMITLKQRGFYLVPSIPFFIMSISFFLLPYLEFLLLHYNKLIIKWLPKITALGFVVIFVVATFLFGKTARDEEKLKDVYIIAENMPQGCILGASYNTCWDWSFHAYLARSANISVLCGYDFPFLIFNKNESLDSLIIDSYEKVALDLNHYIIFQKINPQHTNPTQVLQ